MEARQCATAAVNQPRLCFAPSRRLLALFVGGALCAYAYVWRHYLGIVLAPPSSFRYRDHYRDTIEKADASQVTKLRKELTETLPYWIADYVEWHAQARASGLQSNNSTTRILLVSIEEHHRGGLADRLRSLPFLLWEAVRTKRIFLMQWMNPCALEEFLLPPLGGIDWTVPANLDTSHAVWYIYDEHDNMQLADNGAYQEYPLIKTWHTPWTFVEGMPLLAKTLNVTSLSDPIFSHMYRLLLAPSPPVQRLMNDTMNTLELQPYQYNGVHLRARYPGASPVFEPKSSLFSRSVDADGFKWTLQAKQEVLRVANHAIDCLDNNTTTTILPIYFASDTNEAVKLVTQQDNVVGMVTPLEKMHLDRNDRVGLIRQTPPSAFYPALVDLWILSRAQCLAVGAGGYGVFASILGETDCLVFHSENSFVGGNTARYCLQKESP